MISKYSIILHSEVIHKTTPASWSLQKVVDKALKLSNMLFVCSKSATWKVFFTPLLAWNFLRVFVLFICESRQTNYLKPTTCWYKIRLVLRACQGLWRDLDAWARHCYFSVCFPSLINVRSVDMVIGWADILEKQLGFCVTGSRPGRPVLSIEFVWRELEYWINIIEWMKYCLLII